MYKNQEIVQEMVQKHHHIAVLRQQQATTNYHLAGAFVASTLLGLAGVAVAVNNDYCIADASALMIGGAMLSNTVIGAVSLFRCCVNSSEKVIQESAERIKELGLSLRM